jgi:hypothetical protein
MYQRHGMITVTREHQSQGMIVNGECIGLPKCYTLVSVKMIKLQNQLVYLSICVSASVCSLLFFCEIFLSADLYRLCKLGIF